MDSSRTHRSETFSFFPRDFSGLKLGRSHKTRSRTADGRTTAPPTSVPSEPSSHPHTRVPSRLPASVQHLPPEIVLNILSFALPSLYDQAADFRYAPNAFFAAVEAAPHFRSVLAGTQHTLRNAALICRAWYPVAVEFLYGCPFLNSSRSTLALSRTLEASPRLRPLVKEVWLFNEDGPKFSDPLGTKRKSTRRVQATFTATLRAYTSLDYLIVCNHGLMQAQDSTGQGSFPLDNVMVYGLPISAQHDRVPSLTLYGPSFFNQPWDRHPKPGNLHPDQLTRLCLRDIGPSPARLKCAPYLPTLPYVHTLQIALAAHDDAPIVSSGTLPFLRTLEVYRDVWDDAPIETTRSVGVDEAVLGRLTCLHFVGRPIESSLFRRWTEGERFEELRELAVGPLRPEEHEFIAEWKLPGKLETLTVVVRHKGREGKGKKRGQGAEPADVSNILKALHACVHRNRQARSLQKLVVRSTGVLPTSAQKAVEELEEKCASHSFGFELHEGGQSSFALLVASSDMVLNVVFFCRLRRVGGGAA